MRSVRAVAVFEVGFWGRGGFGVVTDPKCQPIRVRCWSREMQSRCWVSSPGPLSRLVVGAELSPHCV